MAASAVAAPTAVAISTAGAADLDALFALVNAAYQVETGNTGVAFKNCNRLLSAAEIAPSVLAGRCLKAALGEELAGCICFEEQAAHSVAGAASAVGVAGVVGAAGAAGAAAAHMHFGPFAVARSAQGRGVGRALLEALYAECRVRGIRYVDIEVVNWRTDVMPWYLSMGYVPFGEGSFPAPERLSRPSTFVLMRLDLDARTEPPKASSSGAAAL